MAGAQTKWHRGYTAAIAVMLLAGVGVGVGAALNAADKPAATSEPSSVAADATPAQLQIPVTTMINPEIAKLAPGPTTPRTVEDLKAIQARVEAVVKADMPAVVSIQLAGAQGSGVIVSKEGYVLTAGHVSGRPGTRVTLLLADGRRLRGVSLGANDGIDSGMIKILEKGNYPVAPVGSAKKLVSGQWTVVMGHPGGYMRGRPPVVRLGRVLMDTPEFVATDAPLISGDSGGPLFDLDGRLVGINDSIGEGVTQNLHVPIDTFTDTWERLARGDEWGGSTGFFDFSRRNSPVAGEASLGVRAFPNAQGAVLRKVRSGTPAERGGLKVGDIITKFNGRPVKTPDDLAEMVGKKRPGDTVRLQLLRDSREVNVSVKLGMVPRQER